MRRLGWMLGIVTWSAVALAQPDNKTKKGTLPPSKVNPKPQKGRDGRPGVVAPRLEPLGRATVYDEGRGPPELAAFAQAEHEMFPDAPPQPPREHRPLSFGLEPQKTPPNLLPSPFAPPSEIKQAEPVWLSKLDQPDLPVRWDSRVIKYLEFFKDDPRGKATLALWARRSGRYRDFIRRTLKRKNMPEDLAWLAMIESGYDPMVRSPAGAVGLWQFMSETGRTYGLAQDRWVDERMGVRASTEGATEYLLDLFRKFGTWELAMAAYNFGHGGMLGVVKRTNSTDYWAISQIENTLPWETTLYVPKIIAAAVAMRNPQFFGVRESGQENSLLGDELRVPGGTTLQFVAQASGVSTKEIEQLNPEIRLGRTPPGRDYLLRIPEGKLAQTQSNLSKMREDKLAVYTLRAGETLEQIAQKVHVSSAQIRDLNRITPAETLRDGTVLLLPKGAMAQPASDEHLSVVVVPAETFRYADRKRVFHRVQLGDTLFEVAEKYRVGTDEVGKWNSIDPVAKIHEGMTLQLFVPQDLDISRLPVLLEGDVKVVSSGSEEYLQLFELKGRKRIVVKAKQGETLASIASAHHVSPALLERINRRGRTDALPQGSDVIVYVDNAEGRSF